MSSHIKKEILDWVPLPVDRAVDRETKVLIGKLSKLKVDHLTRIDHFNAWLIAITGALRSAGLNEAYLSHEERVSICRFGTGEQWIIISRQIASWMKYHVDDSLIRVLRTRGEALTFADTFIDKAKKVFVTGPLADECRVKNFLAIKPAKFASISQFVTAYEEGFQLMRSHKIELAPYPALLGMLLHIEQANGQVHHKIHYMLEYEIDIAKYNFADAKSRSAKKNFALYDHGMVTTSDVVTVEFFQDFANRAATLLQDEAL